MYAQADAYRVSAPGDYLTHDEFPVDDPTWFTADDVAHGFDSVAYAAIAWMTAGAGVAGDGASRASFLAATPNPFRDVTRLQFALPIAGEAKLEIFDLAGRRLRVLLNERSLPAGTHVAAWDGRDESGDLVGAGVYLCRLETGGRSEAWRVARLR
jgi:hypothetical protein